MLAATADYFGDENTFEMWLTERCLRGYQGYEEPVAGLYTSYRLWTEDRGEKRTSLSFSPMTGDALCHFNVTAHPTAAWTAQQMLEAFPFDTAPKYLLRDRDGIYGQEFRKQVEAMNINEVVSAPRSRWQRRYVERIIGSIRRECLDHMIIFNEDALRRTFLTSRITITRAFISL